MRDIKRIKKILGILEEIWSRNPDQRFGQLLINLGVVKDDFDTLHVEDDLMERHLMKIKKTKKPM
jgi:uncharacterized protein YihD (DUF1040 family)